MIFFAVFSFVFIVFKQAQRQKCHRAALHGAANFRERGVRHLLYRADETCVPLFAVRLEVSVIDRIEIGRVLDCHYPAVITGGTRNQLILS